MQVSEAIDEYQFASLRKSPATQRWLESRMGMFRAWCEREGLTLDTLKPADIRRYIDGLATGTLALSGKPLSTYTVNGHARILKAFFRWCLKEDGIAEHVSPRLPLVPVPKVQIKVIEHLSPQQLDALLAACKKECTPALVHRDRAIVTLLRDSGIRASELTGLTLERPILDPYDGYIRVVGKGDKEREVGLTRDARAAVFRYVHRYRKARPEERHTFVNRMGQPMTANGLDQMLYRLAEWGHVSGVQVSAHVFRHSFAVNYLAREGDLYKLSRLLGHSTVTVTEIYLRSVTQREARRGMSALDRI